MKLTTKGRYAVTAMLDVAMHSAEGPVTLAEIAERQHLSLSYLEQLFARLRRKGLVRSVRGPGGGYRLGSRPEQISVADVILAVDEPVDVTRCGGKANCHRNSRCLTHDLWTELSQQLQDYLSQRSLMDVLQRRVGAERLPVQSVKGTPRRSVPIVLHAAHPLHAAGGSDPD